ncbi:hypothetical protein C0J52_06343 [Blattella germanica]|nr:hypothetical protein C0J52_06343 [Blattella germanica]
MLSTVQQRNEQNHAKHFLVWLYNIQYKSSFLNSQGFSFTGRRVLLLFVQYMSYKDVYLGSLNNDKHINLLVRNEASKFAMGIKFPSSATS